MRFCRAAILLIVAGSALSACPLRADELTPASSAQTVSLAQYVSQLQAEHSLATACSQQASACDSNQSGPDETVHLDSGASFNVRNAWLRDALSSAKTLPDAPRAALMRQVETHLDADLSDTRPSSSQPDFTRARHAADAILASREFRTVHQESLWDRLRARLYQWLDRVLGHVAAFGSRSPWIGPLIEWLLGITAATLLLAWIFRNLRGQRLRMALEAARPMERSEERVQNWLREAEEHAGGERYRDAVHCLYWAGIAALDGRRLWHPDRARTPREYLRLLDATSPVLPLLQRQTLSLESIWYGLRPAHRQDYDIAFDLYRRLRTA